jgi:probable rRNA maturation factor
MEDSEQGSSLDISGLPDSLEPLQSVIERAARELLTEHDMAPFAISISFVGDEEIAGINQSSLGRPGPTDVIAFDLSEDGLPYKTVGDIYVSLDTARENAACCGVGLGEELVRLSVHGILHVIGYLDEEPADKARMEAEQERVVSRFRQEVPPGQRPQGA